jgi:hypothetical protein
MLRRDTAVLMITDSYDVHGDPLVSPSIDQASIAIASLPSNIGTHRCLFRVRSRVSPYIWGFSETHSLRPVAFKSSLAKPVSSRKEEFFSERVHAARTHRILRDHTFSSAGN